MSHQEWVVPGREHKENQERGQKGKKVLVMIESTKTSGAKLAKLPFAET